MQAACVQLLGRGSAAGAAVRQACRIARLKAPDRAQRHAGAAVAALDAAFFCLCGLAIMTQRTLDAPIANAIFLQQEEARPARVRGLHIGLFAGGAELALRGLKAQQPLPARNRLMLRFHAQVIGLVLEGGANGAILDFVVAVVGHTAAQTQHAEARERVAQFATHIQPVAAHVHHRHVASGVLVLVVMAMLVAVFIAMIVVPMVIVPAAVQVVAVRVAALDSVVMPRQTVLGVLLGDRKAQIALRADPRQAQAAAAGAVEAAGNARAARPAAAHAVVVGVAARGLHVHGDVARAAGERDGTGLLFGARADACLRAALVALLGNGRGNLVVQQVDHAADRACAVDQRRWTAQHLDLRGQQRLGGYGVVGAYRGSVLNLGAVRQQFHARAVHATNHRAAGARAEVAAGDARLALQRFAQRGFTAAHQRVAFQHGDGRGHVVDAEFQAAGRNRHLGQLWCVACIAGLGMCGAKAGVDKQKHGAGQRRKRQ
ncbi:hypothetical protein SDC9_116959 [bioreactor metagenome]|uniref:Uncharacterized protein n=1 Tax=bioreactor metagenome TaxID=1076179 RepID=A0A645BZA6_9ZZZZ